MNDLDLTNLTEMDIARLKIMGKIKNTPNKIKPTTVNTHKNVPQSVISDFEKDYERFIKEQLQIYKENSL